MFSTKLSVELVRRRYRSYCVIFSQLSRVILSAFGGYCKSGYVRVAFLFGVFRKSHFLRNLNQALIVQENNHIRVVKNTQNYFFKEISRTLGR